MSHLRNVNNTIRKELDWIKEVVTNETIDSIHKGNLVYAINDFSDIVLGLYNHCEEKLTEQTKIELFRKLNVLSKGLTEK